MTIKHTLHPDVAEVPRIVFVTIESMFEKIPSEAKIKDIKIVKSNSGYPQIQIDYL